jgi:hypothetical protein
MATEAGGVATIAACAAAPEKTPESDVENRADLFVA